MDQISLNEIYALKDLIVGLSIPYKTTAVSIENGKKISNIISLALDKLEFTLK